jgi:hypothetical protein
MPKIVTATAKTEDGVLYWDNWFVFYAQFATWTDGPALVTVERPKKRRTTAQNSWLHAVLIPLVAEQCGYDRHERDWLRYHLLGLCFGTHKGPLGEDVPNVDGSRNLSTVDFSTFMEWSVRWAADKLDVRIPLPDDPIIDALLASEGERR